VHPPAMLTIPTPFSATAEVSDGAGKVDERSQISGWGPIAILIGVVLSIAWTVVMVERGREQLGVWVQTSADAAKDFCLRRNETEGRQDNCWVAWSKAYFEAQQRNRDIPYVLKPGVMEALLPVAAAWLIACGVIAAFRWVAEGIRKDNDGRGIDPQ